jgi:hypothetical protein
LGRNVLLHDSGKERVAIVPIEDGDLLRIWEDRIDVEQARQAIAEAEEHGYIPWETVKANLGVWADARHIR